MSQQQRRQEPPWFNTLCLLQTQLRQLIQHQGEHQQPVSFQQDMLNDLKYQEILLKRGILSNQQLQLEVEEQMHTMQAQSRSRQAQNQQRLQYEQQQQGLRNNEEQLRKLGQELLRIDQRRHELTEQQQQLEVPKDVITTYVCNCGKEYIKAINRRRVAKYNKCKECTRRYYVDKAAERKQRKLKKNQA